MHITPLTTMYKHLQTYRHVRHTLHFVLESWCGGLQKQAAAWAADKHWNRPHLWWKKAKTRRSGARRLRRSSQPAKGCTAS